MEYLSLLSKKQIIAIKMFGSLIGGGISAIGGIAAGAAANKGFNQAIEMYQNRMNQVTAHRDKLYYQDPTQSAENQAAVTQARELLNAQTQRAAANNIVTGGSDESLAMQKASAAKTVGDMMQQQAVQGAAKKEQIWDNADRQLESLNNQIAQMKLQKAQNKAQAISSAASGLASAANGLPI